MNVTDFYKQLEETTKSGKPPRIIESGQGAYLKIDGVDKLNFCSSHYLGQAFNGIVYYYGFAFAVFILTRGKVE